MKSIERDLRRLAHILQNADGRKTSIEKMKEESQSQWRCVKGAGNEHGDDLFVHTRPECSTEIAKSLENGNVQATRARSIMMRHFYRATHMRRRVCYGMMFFFTYFRLSVCLLHCGIQGRLKTPYWKTREKPCMESQTVYFTCSISFIVVLVAVY